MNLAKVIGAIWSSQKDPMLDGLKLQIIQPVDSLQKKIGQPIIAVDSVGAGTGENIFYVTSSEAVIPLENKPALTDATIIGIVDKIEVKNDLA